MTLLIAASYALLSISSTNEYYFTSPGTTNLEGRTYILNGCAVPRYEDIAFLREAYLERAASIAYRWGVADVPESLALGSGRFSTPMTIPAMFAPSFGYWGGYTDYESGFFLKPGIEIQPDAMETDSNYVWENGQDTSSTNTIRAFVKPATACMPTNNLAVSALSGVVCTSNILAAYSILTNGTYNVLDRYGFVYSMQSNNTPYQVVEGRSPENLQYQTYSYVDYNGNVHDASAVISFDMSSWTLRYRAGYTNSIPYAPTYYRIASERDSTRYYTKKLIYQGETPGTSTFSYERLGDDENTLRMDVDTFEGVGNIYAAARSLDYMLTNTVTNVTCIVVCRFRVIRQDFYTNNGGLSNVPAIVVHTNYFVSVNHKRATRTEFKYNDNTRLLSVWDVGVSIQDAVKAIVRGFGYDIWARQCPYPVLDRQPPIDGGQGFYALSAARTRSVLIEPVEVLPYFYFRRLWNARLPEFDP